MIEEKYNNQPLLYSYKLVDIIKVVDGDTIDVLIDLGFKVFTKQRIRLSDFDAPEIFHPLTESEKEAGHKCKEKLKDIIDYIKTNNLEMYIKTKKHTGKYGRYIGEIFFKDIDEGIKSINDLMVKYIKENNFEKENLRK